MQSQAATTAEPETSDWSEPLSRLTSADARQSLERLKASPLVGEGKVCLIGLDSVRERLATRWPARRDMVYEHVNQTLRRQLGAHGFFLRISETDFLVAQPAVSPLAGQAYCLNCLREILTHFLGEALDIDVVVHQVMSIGDGEIDARKLDVGRVDAAAAAERTAAATAAAAHRQVMSQDRWTPFVAQDGRTLRASCALEPVFQLKTFGRIGYRLTRRVLQAPGDKALTPAELRKLTGADIEKIDFATLARGLNRLQQETDADRQPSLILPVSYVTLSSHRGRATLVDFLRAAQSAVQRGLICEVCDIEGVPPSALLAATSLIKPFSLFTVGRLSQIPAGPLTAMKDVGLHGFSIERPQGALAEAELNEFARAVVAAIRPVARAAMLFGLSGPREAALANLNGATHASFALASDKPPAAEDAGGGPT